MAGLCVAPAAVHAQGSDAVPANECCLPLLLPVGARTVAVGQTLAARAGAEEAVFVNPAGLVGIRGDQFMIHRSSGIAGEGSTFSVLFSREAIGTIGLTYHILDGGEIQATDMNGRPVGTLLIRDHVLVASFATHVGYGLSAGFNYKLYHFANTCRGSCGGESTSGTTHAVDVGAHFSPRWLPALQVGASVLSVGFPLQVVNFEQADVLPSRLRLGLAYNALSHSALDSIADLWVSAEIVQSLRHSARRVPSIGVELAFDDALFLRAGYVHGQALEGWTAIGLGVRYQRFHVSVAKPFAGMSGDPDLELFEMTFGIRF